MSEPQSSNDIEDVLSSIRRLVSEDLRPMARTATPDPVASPAIEANDKLILTPALRVVETAEASPPRPQVRYPRTVEIVDFEADPEAEERIEPAEMEKVFATLAPASETEALGDFEQDVSEAPMFDGAMMTPEQEAEAVPVWAQVGFDRDEIADDLPPPAASAQSDAEWVDAAEASVIASLASDPSDPAQNWQAEPPSAQSSEADEELLFNEEVLRDLVRDILREELAGSMGERITRNIRKMVRAEIARGLATQDLG
jgi:hypothetical protein